MSKFWKALGITTALAALVPVIIKKDKETGKKTYQSLLMSLDIKTGETEQEKEIGLNIGDGVISSAIAKAVTARREAELFADDEPEAAVFPEEVQAATDAAKAAADEVQAAVSPEEEAPPSAPVIADIEDGV